MLLDGLLAAYCLVGAISGYRRGVGLELIKLGGALVGGLIGVFLVSWLGDYMNATMDISYVSAQAWAFLAAGGLILLLTDLPARIVGLLRKSVPSRTSRGFGAGLGFVRNLLIAALLAGLIQYYPGLWSGFQSQAFASTYTVTMEPVVRSSLGDDHLLFTGREIVEDPEMADRVAESREVQELAEDPRVQQLVSDPEILRAAREGDYATLAQDPRINELLQDPEFRQKLQKSLRKAVKKARKKSENGGR